MVPSDSQTNAKPRRTYPQALKSMRMVDNTGSRQQIELYMLETNLCGVVLVEFK
jgi:hypothetical protein